MTTSSPAPSGGDEELGQPSKPEQAKAQNIRDYAHVAASEQVGSDGTSVFHEDCYALLKDRITKSMMVECPAMEELGLLQHILSLYGRTLTEAQYTVLLQVIRRFPRQQAPIVASVLVQRFITWPSHTPIPGAIASAHDDDHETAFFDCRSIGALCVQLFQHVEARHGRQLVRFALAYISLARFGVTESELFELLSLSDDVLSEVCACPLSCLVTRNSPRPSRAALAVTIYPCLPIAPCQRARSCCCSKIWNRCCPAKALPDLANAS